MIVALGLAWLVGSTALTNGRPFRDAVVMAIVAMIAFAPAAFTAVLLHELVHAVTARCLGQTVTRVVVGEGRLLARFGRGTQLMLGSVLVGNGMTYVTDRRAEGYRTRWAVVLMSAPMASLVIGAIAWQLSATWPDVPRTAVRMFAAANLFMAAISFIPVPAFGGHIWSDLASTLFLMRATQTQLEEHRVQSESDHVKHLLDTGRPDDALAAARAAVTATPSSPAAHSILAYMLHTTGRVDEAREVARAASGMQMDDDSRAYFALFLSHGAEPSGSDTPTAFDGSPSSVS